MCFVLAVAMNQKLATHNKYTGRIAYILDAGNSKAHHIVRAHGEVIQMQNEINWNAGSLHFEDDRDFGLLQAADVIAWGARRRDQNQPFPRGMEPIKRILDRDSFHAEKDFEQNWMKEMSDKIMTAHRKALAEQYEKEEYE
jgi:hypothetical protein